MLRWTSAGTPAVDAVLKPGDCDRRKIEIVAESIALETTQPELGALIENEGAGRATEPESTALAAQIDNFLTLTPGVTGDSFSHRINGGLGLSKRGCLQRGGRGQPVGNPGFFQTIINPPYELVSEFRVLTSVFSRAIRLGARRCVLINSLPERNTLHGDAFEILPQQLLRCEGRCPPRPPAYRLPSTAKITTAFRLAGRLYLPKVYHGKRQDFLPPERGRSIS